MSHIAIEHAMWVERVSGTTYEMIIEEDPIELVTNTDKAGGFVAINGRLYFADPSRGTAALSAKQLRIIAQELDNQNGVH